MSDGPSAACMLLPCPAVPVSLPETLCRANRKGYQIARVLCYACSNDEYPKREFY